MAKKTSTPYDRLLILKEWLQTHDPKCKNNESEVLRRLGLGVGYFGTSAKQKNKNLREPTYKKIGESWPDVNIEWLRTGDGDMFNDPIIIEEENANGIPYYDVDFLGGFDEMENDQTINPTYYINFPPYNRNGVVSVNLSGDSMSPRINSGDKVFLQPIERIDDIIFGEIYAIVTVSGMRTVKWVTRSPEKGMIRLIPENKDPRYGDYQDLPKTDIRRIFKVLGAVRAF